MKESLSQRRKFIKMSLISSLGLVTAKAAATCGIATPEQTEGPFYPHKLPADKDNDLTFLTGSNKSAKGQVVIIKGQVMDQNCSPIKNALVEIWQACESGRYNHPNDPNTKAQLDPHFQYWGKDVTDQNGYYTFKTIIPGAYPATADWIRPAHVHFKIQKLGYHELTTQMYFAGDPYNAEDKILLSLPADQRESVIVDFSDSADGTPEGIFDITIQSVS